jgi:hexosaminidase
MKSFPNFLLSLCLFYGCQSPRPDPVIVPAAIDAIIGQDFFTFKKDALIVYENGLKDAALLLGQYTNRPTAPKNNPTQPESAVVFAIDNALSGEHYKLDIDKTGVSIKSGSVNGALRAVQTMRLLLPEEFETPQSDKGSAALPFISIADAPAFSYRGMHLDVSRHFFPVAFVKKYIDLMALLKFNVFHWHLTDDQGWRIEIDGFSKLNSVGSFRDETLVGHYNDAPAKYDGKPYGGYYSKDDISEVVEFARARGIEVIPEIDIPGHSSAILAAYPEFGCKDHNDKVATTWGIFDAILCPKPETFEFLDAIFDEILPLFPSKYVHIGGDEAVKTRWLQCPNCQALIKQNALKNEYELQAYFVQKVADMLDSKGKSIIGWDEILEGGLSDKATIMSWRGVEGGVAAAKAGMDAIMTPTSYCYFDYYQSEKESEPLAIGGFLPLQKVYEFNPIPEGLNENESAHILGGQGNVWTEYLDTPQAVEYMAFPRMIALSEALWSGSKRKDFKNFVNRLERFKKRLDALAVNYANHLYEIKGVFNDSTSEPSYSLFTSLEGQCIRFTTDGSTPTAKSLEFKKPIPIRQNTTIKALVFQEEIPVSDLFEQKIQTHLGFGKTVIVSPNPHSSYSSGGPKALVNGIEGSNKRFGDSEWLGFWGDDVSISLDLGEETDVQTLSTRFFNSNGQWVYAPKTISVQADGQAPVVMTIQRENTLVTVRVPIHAKTRFLKIEVVGFGMIPDHLQGGGHPAWTFIDELIIE